MSETLNAFQKAATTIVKNQGAVKKVVLLGSTRFVEAIKLENQSTVTANQYSAVLESVNICRLMLHHNTHQTVEFFGESKVISH